jgi:type I restriction enzyme S subunit
MTTNSTHTSQIASDWPISSLGELYDFKNGANGDKSIYGRGIPFINVLEPISHSHISNSQITGKIDLNQSIIDLYRVRFGDIVLNRTSETQEEVGLIAVYNDHEPAVFGGFVIRGRPKSNKVEPKFAGYAFRSPFVRRQIIAKGQGAVRANIGQTELRNIQVPLPPLPEQRAIAEALSDIDDLINSLDKLIAKKRAIKQATMQQLLTGKTRLPGFSKEWLEKTLRNFVSVFSGGTPSTSEASYYGGEIPWITSGDLNGGVVTEVAGRITSKGLTNSAAKMVKKDTLLIALYGATAGVVAITRIDATINQAVLAIIPTWGDPVFLYYKLSLLKDWIITTYTQGGQPNLSGSIVSSISFSLPEPNEQVAIGKILTDIDEEIFTFERSRDKTKLLKQGMMQELLTGKTRLL